MVIVYVMKRKESGCKRRQSIPNSREEGGGLRMESLAKALDIAVMSAGDQ